MPHVIERLNTDAIGVSSEGVHIPRALPDETVEIGDDGSAKIITPSHQRVKPPCPHYKACGGCSLQHANDEFVAGWKVDVLRKALDTKSVDAPDITTYTSPAQSRRRAKFSATRTKKGAMVGFMAARSNILIPISTCLVVDPKLVEALPTLEELTVEFASRKEVLGLQVTTSDDGLDVVIDTDRPLTDALRQQLALFAQKNSLARLAWKDEVIVTIRQPAQTFGSVTVVPPSGSFLQATPQAEKMMAQTVIECVGDATAVLDLFAGVGTFALQLANTSKVHAVEGDAEMMAALDTGWRKSSGLKHVSTETRDLFRRPLLPDEMAKFDVIVIDPPRAGAQAQFTEIAQSNIAKVVSISCNPVSFARDAAILTGAGYRLRQLWVVDQFRWSSHIEVIGYFEK